MEGSHTACITIITALDYDSLPVLTIIHCLDVLTKSKASFFLSQSIYRIIPATDSLSLSLRLPLMFVAIL